MKRQYTPRAIDVIIFKLMIGVILVQGCVIDVHIVVRHKASKSTRRMIVLYLVNRKLQVSKVLL